MVQGAFKGYVAIRGFATTATATFIEKAFKI